MPSRNVCGVQPTADFDDFVVHERHRAESTAESKKIDSEHEGRQIENSGRLIISNNAEARAAVATNIPAEIIAGMELSLLRSEMQIRLSFQKHDP